MDTKNTLKRFLQIVTITTVQLIMGGYVHTGANSSVCEAAVGPSLPDFVGEWKASTMEERQLATVSDDLGLWQSRNYKRKAPAAAVNVNLIYGSGTGTLIVQSDDISKNDAPIGFVSIYKTMTVGGKRAVFERGEVTGVSLAVQMGERSTLTLESNSLTEQELLSFAEQMIKALH